jgi:Arc/MetJ-type ribon-helix-helix transcriptional regulator
MTKEKIAITIDREVLILIETKLKSGLFRNRSHLIEYSIKKLLGEENEKQF